MHKKGKSYLMSHIKYFIGSSRFKTNDKPLKVDFTCPRAKWQGRHCTRSRHFENRRGEGPGDEVVKGEGREGAVWL